MVKGNQPLKPGVDGKPVKFKLATNTAVNFLCSHHDLVFAVDVSFSTISGVGRSILRYMMWNNWVRQLD